MFEWPSLWTEAEAPDLAAPYLYLSICNTFLPSLRQISRCVLFATLSRLFH